MTRKRSYRSIGAEIIALLIVRPRPWPEVQSTLKLAEGTADEWLKSLRQVGVVYIAGYVQYTSASRKTRIYAMQAKPFEKADEPYPRVDARPSRPRKNSVVSAPELVIPHSAPASSVFEWRP